MQEQKFYIQGADFATNGQQIKQIKKAILKDAYEHQLNSKKMTKNQEYFNPEYQSSIHSSRSRSLGNLNQNTPLSQNAKSSRQQIMEQKDFLSKLITLQNQQKESAKIAYRKQLLDEIKRKEILKKQTKKKQLDEYNLRFVGKASAQQNKFSSFKQYYQSLGLYQDKIAGNYLQSIGQKRKLKEKQQKLKQEARVKQFTHLMEHQALEQFKRRQELKQDLKDSLELQINSIRQQKKDQFNYKSPGYFPNQKYIHNPIINPIDYKTDIHNRYIIGQIRDKSSQK